jgi:hypothetical protein
VEYAGYRLTGIIGQYAGMDEAVDYVLLAVTDIVEVHAAVFGRPMEDEMDRGRDGVELAFGDPADFVGLGLLGGSLGRPLAFGGRQERVERGQLARDGEGLISH